MTKSNKVATVEMEEVDTAQEVQKPEKNAQKKAKDLESLASHDEEQTLLPKAKSVTSLETTSAIANYFKWENLIRFRFISMLYMVSLLPLIFGVVMTWWFSSKQGIDSIDKLIDETRLTDEDIIISKIDSVMDASIEKLKNKFEGTYGVAKAGAAVELQISDEPYDIQIKDWAFWTRSIAEPWHYPLVYVVFECNGHIVGTGYDYETKTFTAIYTNFNYTYNNRESLNGVIYDSEGCNTVDYQGTSTEEITYVTDFTDGDYWKKYILIEGFDDHGTMRRYDGRKESWYKITAEETTECAWAEPFAAIQPPYKVSTRLSVQMHKANEPEKLAGMIAIDFTLDDLQFFVQSMNSELKTLNMIVVNAANKVLAATEGEFTYPPSTDCNGNTIVEMYDFADYAEKIYNSMHDHYTVLLDFKANNPQFAEGVHDNIAHMDNEDQHHYYPTHAKMTTKSGIMLVSAIHATDYCGLDLTIYVMVEEEELLGALEAKSEEVHKTITSNVQRSVYAIIGISFVTLLIGGLVSLVLSRPLEILRKDITKVCSLDFSGTFDKTKPFIREMGMITKHYTNFKATLLQFSCYVPPHIVEELIEDSNKATERVASRREVAFFFVHIANFSAASHNAEACVVADFANSFIGETANILSNMKGTVIDFFGDQLFGIFNAPYDDPDYLTNAIQCAVEVKALFDRVKAQFTARYPDFDLLKVRIGVHCGPALVGKVGSKSRLKYCALGDNVNLGSRIENMNTRYGSSITCSKNFLDALGPESASTFAWRPMEFVKVQGRDEAVLICEIAGPKALCKDEVIQEYAEHRELFDGVRKKTVAPELVDAHINKYKGAAEFLKSASISLKDLREIKKL